MSTTDSTNFLAKSFAKNYSTKFGRKFRPISALSAMISSPFPGTIGLYLTTKYLQVSGTQSGLMLAGKLRYFWSQGLSWMERVQRKNSLWVRRREQPMPWKQASRLARKGQLLRLYPILQFREKIFSCLEISLKGMYQEQRSMSIKTEMRTQKGRFSSISMSTPTEPSSLRVLSRTPFSFELSSQLPPDIYYQQCRMSLYSCLICQRIYVGVIEAISSLG